MNSQNSISVVIPVFNQVALTDRCLQSLFEGSKLTRELLVVDNASKDQTPETLKNWKDKFIARGWKMEIITNPENRGFGRACNQGIRGSEGEFVAILNNDTWLMPGWDESLFKRIDELQADMIGPYYDETPFDPVLTPERGKKFVTRNRGRTTRDWVSILMFFRRSALERMDCFDERYFVTYEDTDLREKMKLRGMKHYTVGDCFIWHHSKGTRSTQKLPSDYEAEGLRLFQEKWGFDPRPRENTRSARLSRRWRAIRNRFGYL